MPQDVVIPGVDWVWAHHQDGQDLSGMYGEITYTFPDNSTLVQPAADVVQTPRGFIYAYDELGRLLDPRRFAGEGGTPIGGATAHGTRTGPILSSPPSRTRDPVTAPVMPSSTDPDPDEAA